MQLWMIITYTKIKFGVSVPFVLIWHGSWAAGAVGFVSMTRRAFTDIILYSWVSPLPTRYATAHTHTAHVAHCIHIHTRDQQDNHMLFTEVPTAGRRCIAVGFYVLKRWKICTLRRRIWWCMYIFCMTYIL